MVARDEHAIILIGPFELSLQPGVVLDHQQCAQSGPALVHVIPIFVTRASPPAAARASASGNHRVKLLPLPGSLATSIAPPIVRSEEHTSELQSLMRISYAVFSLKKKKPDNPRLRESHYLLLVID